ncbi:hypothetical protein LTR09_012391 [Extremus antarcticus]|uniref:Amino acid permease n=1 Tax=Extremus antarcticus TaxID=702011 RepID=A0AAJ0DAF2_9PEZI|nr:hypothetical protein LTR09_012391 [Extremus antarcticus]
MFLAYGGSVYCAKLLPYLQNLLFVVHIIAFFGLTVPIWVNAKTATHQQVWFDFVNSGGWSSAPLAVLVGQLTPISQQVGIDTVAHMSEEVRDASKSVPRAMLTVYGMNFVLMFVAFVTICYHLPHPQAALNDPSGYETIYVMRQSMSKGGMAVLLVVIILLNLASNVMYLTATTRDLFAFARDKGVPFSTWLSKVHRKRKIPQNASSASGVFAILLSLIYIGSPTAFWAINSLLTVALLSCYNLSTGCVLYRRTYHPETLPPASFSLGKWASVIYASVLIIALTYFVLKARFDYTGPVRDVAGRNTHRR